MTADDYARMARERGGTGYGVNRAALGYAPLGGPREFRTEEEFQAAVVALAKANGWLVYHTRDSRRSESGFPDLILLRGRVGMAWELKLKGNEPTEAQRQWMLGFVRAGFDARIIWPSDWAFIEALLTDPPR